MSKSLKLTMQLPCIRNIETVAHSGLDRLGEYRAIPIDKLEEAKLLVNEAVNNAIEHGQGPRNELRVEFTLDENVLLIYVRDYGKGFEVEQVERPDIDKKVTGAHKRGWGLELMKSLSDDFKIVPAKYGTKIYMYLNV